MPAFRFFHPEPPVFRPAITYTIPGLLQLRYYFD